MKQAHLYNLKATWRIRPDWDINILSINTECISMWLPKQENEEDYIISVSITLVKRNATIEKESFLAKGID
jgi:hypothetical protein